EGERPPADLVGVARGADDGHRARAEEALQAHSPVKRGLRFSANARTASSWSRVICDCVSRLMPYSNVESARLRSVWLIALRVQPTARRGLRRMRSASDAT